MKKLVLAAADRKNRLQFRGRQGRERQLKIVLDRDLTSPCILQLAE